MPNPKNNNPTNSSNQPTKLHPGYAKPLGDRLRDTVTQNTKDAWKYTEGRDGRLSATLGSALLTGVKLPFAPILAWRADKEYRELNKEYGNHDLVQAARTGDITKVCDQLSAYNRSRTLVPQKVAELALLDLERKAKEDKAYFFAQTDEHLSTTKGGHFIIELPENKGQLELIRTHLQERLIIPDNHTGIIKYNDMRLLMVEGAVVALTHKGKLLEDKADLKTLSSKELTFLKGIEAKHPPELDEKGKPKQVPNTKVFSPEKHTSFFGLIGKDQAPGFNAPNHLPADYEPVPHTHASIKNPTLTKDGLLRLTPTSATEVDSSAHTLAPLYTRNQNNLGKNNSPSK